MRWLSLFLACQHLSSGTNLRECKDQSWFKVETAPDYHTKLTKVHRIVWLNILSIINVVLTCYWDDWACFWHASTSVRGRIFVSARIRGGSRLKRLVCFVLIDVRCFRVPPEKSLHAIEDHWSRKCGILDISQSHRPLVHDTGIALLFCFFTEFSFSVHHLNESVTSFQRFAKEGVRKH
jgi:hypothetical protein